jgi:hypothetical protein
MQNKHKAYIFFLSDILQERDASEHIPVGVEGITVKFTLRKDGVRV